LTSSETRDSPILIGVHSIEAVRAQEYLLSSNQYFLAHETFFSNELRWWAQSEYHVPTERDSSVVFGFSNGGAFSLATALRNPQRYAAACSFSPPRLPMLPAIPPPGGPKPSVYLAAGNQGPEKYIRKNVLKLSRWLRQNGVPIEVSEKEARHTLDFWASEFVVAVGWLNSRARSNGFP
jgi:S-formylglutathione hydrolase FrmB